MIALGLLMAGTAGCAGFGPEIDPLYPDAGVDTPAAPGGSAAGGAAPAGSGGSVGAGGAGAGGAAGMGGAGGAGGAASPGGPADAAAGGDVAAPAEPPGACGASATFALMLTIDVSWTGTAATMGGTGQVRIWNRVDLTTTGNVLSGMVTPCGTVLPETPLTGIGRVAAGGGKILIEVPTTVWDAPTMPKFPLRGTASSLAIGSTVEIELAAPLGFERPDVKAPWPDSYTGLREFLRDVDGDGKPGYLALPRGSDGYVLPPTSLGLGGLAPAAEKIFLVSRNLMTLTGMRTSCDAFEGTANVTAFDSHVVGCMVRGGGDCTDRQIDFVDQNRMKYQPKGARFVAKRVNAQASCADVRRDLPL